MRISFVRLSSQHKLFLERKDVSQKVFVEIFDPCSQARSQITNKSRFLSSVLSQRIIDDRRVRPVTFYWFKIMFWVTTMSLKSNLKIGL